MSKNTIFGEPLYIIYTLVHYRLGCCSVCRFDIFRRYNIIIWSLESLINISLNALYMGMLIVQDLRLDCLNAKRSVHQGYGLQCPKTTTAVSDHHDTATPERHYEICPVHSVSCVYITVGGCAHRCA